MNKLVLIILLIFCNLLQAQTAATLVVTGVGNTPLEAQHNALRSALEQTYGAYISSETKILNDILVEDRISSITNGKIVDFEVLNEIKISDNNFTITLKATVSVEELVSYAQSKGAEVEFKGSLFAINVKQQILNEQSEVQAIKDVCQLINNIADISFDYQITVANPIVIGDNSAKWRIPMYISVYKNNNFNNIADILYATLKGLTLTKEEAKEYIQLGKAVYPVSIAVNKNDYSYIMLRTNESLNQLLKMLGSFNNSIQNFKISNGIDEWGISDNPENLKYIYDCGFRLFLIKDHSFYRGCSGTSFFYRINRFGCKRNEPFPNVELLSHNFSLSPNSFRSSSYQLTLLDMQNFIKGCGLQEKNHKFSFVNGFDSVIDNKLGLVISFIENSEEDPNLPTEIVRFYYEDIRTINEIEQITEYTIKDKEIQETVNEEATKEVAKEEEIKEAVKQEKSYYGVINDPDGYTNVRDSKSSRSVILFKVYERKEFRIIDKTDDNWWLIEYNGSQGFIYSKKVNIINYGVINDPDGYTNVREGKSSKSEILFKVYEGKKFRIIDKTDDNWWLIGYNGGQGFIYSKKVNVIE